MRLKIKEWISAFTTFRLPGASLQKISNLIFHVAPFFEKKPFLYFWKDGWKSSCHSLGALKEEHLQHFNHNCRSLQVDRLPGWKIWALCVCWQLMELFDEPANEV